MSNERPGGEPEVFRLPPESFRVGEHAPQPQAAPRPEPAPRPRAEPAASPRPRPERAVSDRAAAEDPAPRRRKGWDIALAIVLLVALAALAATASVLGIALGFSIDGCGGSGRLCRPGVLDAGVWTMITVPWLVWAVAVFVVVVRLVVRRRAFWVPLVGAVATVVLWFVGAFLVWAAT